MLHVAKYNVGIADLRFCSPTPEDLEVRARQLSFFMAGIQRYYMNVLGLERVDPDPFPNPENAQERAWRVEKLNQSGLLYGDGLTFLGALKMDADGEPSKEDDGLQALLILRKNELCTLGSHTPVEIVEWDVAARRRGQGLGKLMLAQGVRRAHIHDDMIADVSQDNQPARAVYEHLGFTVDKSVPPRRSDVFDTPYIRYAAPAGNLRVRLPLS